MLLDWGNWNFSKVVTDILSLIHNNNMNATQTFEAVAKFLWGWNVKTQSHALSL